MRALLTTLLLSAAAQDAFAHVLDVEHSLAEQLAHALTAPHHALLLLLAAAVIAVTLRRRGFLRPRGDERRNTRR